MFMNKERHKINLANSEFHDNEDAPVLEFLEKKMKVSNFKLLEVGSGLCRFADKIKLKHSNIECTCLDINSNLSEIARKKGYRHINEDITKNKIPSNSFDIVHCSHVIEHLGYPEIVIALDEMLRLTKPEGYFIIRSPLMSSVFYDDIDHIRPYPPEAILNYFTNIQQQRTGKNIVNIEQLWFRTAPKKFRLIDKSSLFYILIYLRIPINHIIIMLNKQFEELWKKFRFPSSEANGYVLILKKSHSN